jgi:tricorn protease
MKSEIIVEDEFWALSDVTPRFSPDGKYVLYTAYRNFEQDIFVYNFEDKTSKHITRSGVTESEPYWSPDGKYIYFIADRLNPAYPRGTRNTNIYRIALQNFGEEYRKEKYTELFEESNDSLKKSNTAKVEIDFENLRKRWESISSEDGNQYTPIVIQKNDETYVIYSSAHTGERALWKTTIKPFESNKTEKIGDIRGSNFEILGNDDKYYLLNAGKIHKLDIINSSLNPIEIEFTFSKNMKNEFAQMFYETWANMQENYYSQDFHGTDWKEIKNRYEKFIPHVTSRDDLRQLLNDMLGELNSSHQGFSSAGEEEETFYNLKTAYTGIIFQSDKPYTVKRVIDQSPAHKRNINIREGDILTKVNGKKVDNQRNRETYFLFTSLPEEINLIFERDGAELAVNLHPESYAARTRQLYDEWIERNQKIVDSASNERIAYIHMKNMGSGSLRDFKIEISNELHYRDALILDLRYNRGGNVHDDVLQLLSQKPYLQWKYRQGDFAKQPNFYPAAKPIILLINEQTLSDAEMTAEGFKQLGLGKIIGTETYRWIIFTSGKRLVDGSYYRLPSWGCYTLDGKDLEMTGVSPDIYVGKSFKEKIGRQYPQLRRAVEVIMNQLNNK